MSSPLGLPGGIACRSGGANFNLPRLLDAGAGVRFTVRWERAASHSVLRLASTSAMGFATRCTLGSQASASARNQGVRFLIDGRAKATWSDRSEQG